MGNVEEDRAPLETNDNALTQETNKQQIERFAPFQNLFLWFNIRGKRN